MKAVVRGRACCDDIKDDSSQASLCNREVKNKLISAVNACVKRAKQVAGRDKNKLSSEMGVCCIGVTGGSVGVEKGDTACSSFAPSGSGTEHELAKGCFDKATTPDAKKVCCGMAGGQRVQACAELIRDGLDKTADAAADSIIAACLQPKAKRNCCNQIKRNDTKKNNCLSQLKTKKQTNKDAAAENLKGDALTKRLGECEKQKKNPSGLKSCCEKLPKANREACMKAGAGSTYLFGHYLFVIAH